MSYARNSYASIGIFAAVALALTCGASQFASGEDLTVGMRTAGAPAQDGINRIAKTDRAPVVAEPVAPTQTISIHVDRVPDTSVLVRIPATREARGSAPAPLPSPPKAERKMAVACEPVVSVLTEIAKRLQPGRCLT